MYLFFVVAQEWLDYFIVIVYSSNKVSQSKSFNLSLFIFELKLIDLSLINIFFVSELYATLKTFRVRADVICVMFIYVL